jgi:two-component system CheB/CheR fusion protein
VAGCSTGEEAYSLAIVLRETIEASGRPFGFKVFATDLDDSAIRLARYGLYAGSLDNEVSALRIKRFFTREGQQYRISRDIRDRVIFATQNLIQDPPFTRIDCISCRNVLIYLSPALQKKIIPQFHYALNPGGLLVLGLSESVGDCEDKFDVIDKKNKIFRRSDSDSVFSFGKALVGEGTPPAPIASLRSEQQTGQIARQVDRLLLQHYAPTALLIDDHGKLLFVHGDTERYLFSRLMSQGQWTIADLLRDSLRLSVLTAFNQLLQSGEQHRLCKRLTVDSADKPHSVDISITRLIEPEALRDLFVVVLFPREQRRRPRRYELRRAQPLRGPGRGARCL